MTYEQAISATDINAVITASFGYPGEGGYSEYRRTVGGRRWHISNGQWDAPKPFMWAVEEITALGDL